MMVVLYCSLFVTFALILVNSFLIAHCVQLDFHAKTDKLRSNNFFNNK